MTCLETYSDSDAEKTDTPFPNFIVLESVEEKPVTKLSLFVIEKFLSTNISLKSVKATKGNMLVMKMRKKSHTKLFLKMTTLHNIKIKMYPHQKYKSKLDQYHTQ